MAMIQCPECGQTVSDKASNCLHCGAPLRGNKTIKIKIPLFVTGWFSQKACEIELECDGKILWTGHAGQVAQFDVEEESVSVRFLIKKAYTGHPFPFFRNFIIKGEVKQGKKYEIKNTRASLAFGDVTKSDWAFSEVDVIDSGL